VPDFYSYSLTNIEILFENKEPFIQGLDALEILNIDSERIMYFNVSAKYSVFNANENLIHEKIVALPDFKNELNVHFASNKKEVDEKGRYKLWKPYFTKEDIKSIYTIAEQKLVAAE